MREVIGAGPDLLFGETTAAASPPLRVARLLGAILAPAYTLRFDADRRRLIERPRLGRARAWAFDDLGSIVVEDMGAGDGPPTWVVEIGVAGRDRRLRIADAVTEARAEVIAADVERLVRG